VSVKKKVGQQVKKITPICRPDSVCQNLVCD